MSYFHGSFKLLLVLLFITSCRQKPQSEKEEVAYWNAAILDTAYAELHKNRDTFAALRLMDSVVAEAPFQTPFIKAARFDLLSNYYYFYTPDNAATARMVDSALAELALSHNTNSYPQTRVGLLLFGGNIAYRLQQYNKANDYYFRAKNLADTHLDPCAQKAFNYSIAMVLYRQQNFSQSLHYFKEAYALQQTCTPQTKAVLLQQQEIKSNIGLCYVQLGRYDSALHYFDQAWAIANQNKDTLGEVNMEKIQGVIYGNKAQAYMALNQLNKAEQLCLKSIALNARPGYEVENARQVKLQLAEVYHHQGKNAAMFEVLQGLRLELDTVMHALVEVGWRRLASEYYTRTGDVAKGFAMFKSYETLKDSLAEQQKKLSEADVTRQLDVKEKEMQIAILKKDNHIASLFLWVTIGASLLVTIILDLIYQNYRRSKKSLAVSLALNEEIKRQKAAREEEARQRHKEITEAVIRAQESERALIGLELHDNINQVLTTVKLHNEMVLEGLGEARVLLPRASKYLQDCINEIRSLSKRLSAPSLGKISLEESVNDLLDSVNVTNKVKITRSISGINQTLKQDLHLGVYRILQEQLNNVLKHAKASELRVELETKDDFIRLLIADNGQGFTNNSKRGGIGLVNMRTRAENLNGTFELKSAPGAGCSIHVVLPIT